MDHARAREPGGHRECPPALRPDLRDCRRASFPSDGRRRLLVRSWRRLRRAEPENCEEDVQGRQMDHDKLVNDQLQVFLQLNL